MHIVLIEDLDLSPDNARLRHLVVDSDAGSIAGSVTVNVLNQWFAFEWAQRGVAQGLSPSQIVVACHDLALLMEHTMFSKNNLIMIARCHGVYASAYQNKSQIKEELLRHSQNGCTPLCMHTVYVFRAIRRERRGGRVVASSRSEKGKTMPSNAVESVLDQTREDVYDVGDGDQSDMAFPQMCPLDRRMEIVSEFQAYMNEANWVYVPCAVCGQRKYPAEVSPHDFETFPFHLLTNDDIPDHLSPTSYDFERYGRAFLCALALQSPFEGGPIEVCTKCSKALEKGKMPPDAIANYQYYAHECLPDDIKRAFAECSVHERQLIAGCRATNVSYTYQVAENDSGVRKLARRRYTKGNVAIIPQDLTRLADVIPCAPTGKNYSMCVIFLGGTKPTWENITELNPVLVSRSRVEQLTRFLVRNNAILEADGVGFSQKNLDALCPSTRFRGDKGYSSAVEIVHLSKEENASDAATAGYGDRPGVEQQGRGVAAQDLLIDTVGFAEENESWVGRNASSRLAIQWCRQYRPFLAVRGGKQLFSERDHRLLSYLFPHLDPWGIGGFNNPLRKAENRISMRRQLRNMLRLYNGPFERDYTFVFVLWNVVQKLENSRAAMFSVKESLYKEVADDLVTCLPDMEAMATRWTEQPDSKPSNQTERKILQMLNKLKAISRDLPGSNAGRLRMRNEIRALLKTHGCPALFITFTPADIYHRLPYLLSGQDADSFYSLDEVHLAKVIADNPSAAADFFDITIRGFLDTILRYGDERPGLFGVCTAYYATVEAQGRGTLHTHMVVWLEGSPNPQELRDRLRSSPDFTRRMIAWLESIISCELPGMSEALREPAEDVKRPAKESARDPRSMPAPQRKDFPDDLVGSDSFESEFRDFVRQLVVACNWHKHTGTCWKYLTGTQLEVDANCRMRLPAAVQGQTEVDQVDSTIRLRRLHPWIANYNDVMICLLKCNMDIKHIGSGEAAKALVYYITDYMSKAQLPVHVTLNAVCAAVKRAVTQLDEESDQTAFRRSLLTRVVNGIMGKLELSHQQVMSYIVGGGDHYTSHRFRTMNWGSVERFIREQEKGAHGADLDPDDTGDAHELAEDISNGSAKGKDVDLDDRRTLWQELFGLDEEPEESQEVEVVNQGIASDGESDEEGGNASGDVGIETVIEDAATARGNGHGSSDLLMTVSGKTVTASNTLLDYLYRGKTAEFEQLCVWDMVAQVECLSIEQESARLSKKKTTVRKDGTAAKARGRPAFTRVPFSSEAHPRFKTHLSRLRSVSFIPVMLGPSLPRRDRNEEEWCRAMLILFKPWRSLGDLKSMDQSWSDAYNLYQFPERLQRIMKNVHVELECKDARDKHVSDRRVGKVDSLLEGSGNDSDVRDLSDRSLEDALGTVDGGELFFVPASDASEETDPGQSDMALSSKDLRTQQCLQVLERAGVVMRASDVRDASGDRSMSGALFVRPGSEFAKEHESIMREVKRQKRPAQAGGVTLPEQYLDLHPYVRKPRTHIDVLMSDAAAVGGVDVLDLPPSHVLRRRYVLDKLIQRRGIAGNLEQEAAVRIICEHFIEKETNQLIMLVAGTGGTGKSYVTMTVSLFFSLCGMQNVLLRSAPTGIAAVLIEGYTIHALTFLPQSQRTRFTRLDELELLWKDVRYIIIDEVSMISAGFLAKISKRIALAKGREDLPFGGVNVIFMGDFGQLAPVRAKALYDWRLYGKVSARQGQSETGIDELYGAHLWRQLTHVVCLRKNVRQAEDAVYAALNERIRLGRPILTSSDPEVETDYIVLHRRLLSEIARTNPLELERFRNCPIIVADKQVRDAINRSVVLSQAHRLGHTTLYMHARDRAKRRPVSRAVQEKLWSLKSSKSGDLLGALPFFPGMKVMVTENTDMSHLTVNGSEGTLLDVTYETDEYGEHYATCAYVHIPKSGLTLRGLPENVVPIYPVRRSFRLTLRSRGRKSSSFNISREQLPLLPAYAYTDYKSQGRSLENVIVDIASCHDLQSLYVMLSRVKSLGGLALLRRCPYPKFASMSLRHDARAELQRIEAMHDVTLASYRRERQKP